MPRLRVLTMALALVALGGCGNSRTPVPSVVSPAVPHGLRTLLYPAAGVALAVPSNWRVIRERAPLVVVFASASAVVSLWRYARSGAPPTGAALDAAERRLLAATRVRQPSLELIRSRTLRIDRAPAIELDAIERINGLVRRVRSTHIFTSGGELVLEEYAPTATFHAVDHSVFSPLRDSIVLAPA